MSPVPSPAGPVGDSLSWTVGPGTERWLAVLQYGIYAALCGFGLLFAGGAAALAVAFVLEGSWGPLLVGMALAAVLALARPPIIPALRSGTITPDEDAWQPSRRGLLAAAVVGVTVAALLVGASLLAMTLDTEATIDGDLRLETRRGAADLTPLSGVRSLSLSAVTVFVLSYTRGVLVVGYVGAFSLVFATPMLWCAWKG
ncbi:MAG: hypothetical protein V5A38_04595 [Halolamina sp.]|uniref:hypothetical protein n=1 Tax=Halolamina sp. TaxID=1940283 RepID=UPI002FC2B5F9